jgi:hypothetical protein
VRVVIDPDEDIDSLRLKARNERDHMEDCFKRRRSAIGRDEQDLARQLLLEGEAYKDNMMRLNKEASLKIFQGMRLMDGARRFCQLTSSLI